MEKSKKQNIDLPELGVREAARFLWRELTSMRTALILLLLVGVASIPGSLIPQRNQNPQAVAQYFQDYPGLAPWLDRVSAFELYGSSWFSAIYILLFISLIGCVLPRSFEHLKATQAKPPSTPKNLSRLEYYQSFTTRKRDLEIAHLWFKKKRFRVLVQDGSISAEKGYLRETGNLLFHLALILVLIGMSAGSLFGMRGMVIVNSGERFINLPTSYDSLSFGKLFNEESLSPFTIRINKFVAKYNPVTNAAEDYTAFVTVKKRDEDMGRETLIKVNEPLTFGSTRVYLQANGYSPIVTVSDSKGNVAFQGPVPFLPQDRNLRSIGAIKVPDANPQIGFVSSFLPTYSRDPKLGGVSIFPDALDPKLLFSIWEGDLGLDSGVPQSVYRINTEKMVRIALDSLKPGESLDFGKGRITFEGFTPWVNLEIVKDPGKSFALIGSIIAVLGLLASLFGRRRRIWIRINGDGVTEVSGLAKNSAPGLEEEVTEFVRFIQESQVVEGKKGKGGLRRR